MSSQQAKGCLLFHGFTGGPFEVAPVGCALENSGYESVIPVLPGHGGPPRMLRHVTYRDWIRTAEEQAKMLTKEYGSFDLIGFSMGGLLAAYVANRFRVRKLVLLSTPYIYVSPLRYTGYLLEIARTQNWSALQKSKSTPLHATVQFVKLAERLRSEFRRISVPTLIMHGLRDHIIHPKSARLIYERISAPRKLQWLPQSRHLICLEMEGSDVIRTVQQFLTHQS